MRTVLPYMYAARCVFATHILIGIILISAQRDNKVRLHVALEDVQNASNYFLGHVLVTPRVTLVLLQICDASN